MTLRLQRLDAPVRELLFAESESGTFSGYASVFNNRNFYNDEIAPGAFKKTLRQAKSSGNWPIMLLDHGGFGLGADDMMPIGIWTAMAEDDKGLRVEGKLADTVRAREAYGLLKMEPRPALNGMSIGFMARKFTVGTKPDEPRRRIEEVDLIEVSLTAFPADDKARVREVHSMHGINSIRDAERFLRDAGLPRSEAGAFIARLKTMLHQGEPGGEWDDIAAQLRRNIRKLEP